MKFWHGGASHTNPDVTSLANMDNNVVLPAGVLTSWVELSMMSIASHGTPFSTNASRKCKLPSKMDSAPNLLLASLLSCLSRRKCWYQSAGNIAGKPNYRRYDWQIPVQL
jgi:hypothetical protein